MNVEHFETKNCSIFTPILVGISRRRCQGGEGAKQRWDSTKTPVSAISGTEVGQGSKPVLTPRLALA